MTSNSRNIHTVRYTLTQSHTLGAQPALLESSAEKLVHQPSERSLPCFCGDLCLQCPFSPSPCAKLSIHPFLQEAFPGALRYTRHPWGYVPRSTTLICTRLLFSCLSQSQRLTQSWWWRYGGGVGVEEGDWNLFVSRLQAVRETLGAPNIYQKNRQPCSELRV